MATTHLEPLLREAERQAILTVLRAHPRWTLGDLLEHIDRSGPRWATIRALRLEELFTHRSRTRASLGHDTERLRAAQTATGHEFDLHVRVVLDEARPVGRQRGSGWVGASYLRARVGGPRWKLQGSLGRLAAAGEIERRGKTSATVYRSLLVVGAAR